MSAATIEQIDLSWVTFMQEDDDCGACEAHEGCSAQATHLTRWIPWTGCAHRRTVYCLRHTETTLRRAAVNGRLFWCVDCGPESATFLWEVLPL